MTAERLTDLHNSVAAAAYQAATRLGLLDHMAKAPATAPELARQCGTSERGTHLLLAALQALDLVDRLPDGRYCRATSDSAPALMVSRLWQQLERAVRHGKPALRTDTIIGASAVYPELGPHPSDLLRPAATRAAELLPRAMTVLDVGAGAAPWSIALAQRDPACHITALDLPSVLPATRQVVEQAGCTKQFRLLAGDVFTIELPRGAYDLIVLGNLCHLFGDDTNRHLLRRLAPCLAAPGTLAVIDVMPTDPASRESALYELGLFLRTGAGRVHPASDYRRWLSDASLTPTDPVTLSRTPPINLIAATTYP